MYVTNRDLVSLILVIPLLIIRQSSINITVQQFFCEKTPSRFVGILFTSRFVGILFTFTSGATSEYPSTHVLLKSTATVVCGPQSASKGTCMY